MSGGMGLFHEQSYRRTDLYLLGVFNSEYTNAIYGFLSQDMLHPALSQPFPYEVYGWVSSFTVLASRRS